MKALCLTAALLVFASPAFAGHRHATTSQSASASAAASSSYAGGGTGIGGNGFGGNSFATGGTGGFGGGASVNERTSYVVPPGLAALTGTSCMGSSTVSGGAMTFGVGFGTTWEDHECSLRENIKVVAQFNPDLAYQMTAELSGVQAAMKRMPPPPEPARVPVEATYNVCDHPAVTNAQTWQRFCE